MRLGEVARRAAVIAVRVGEDDSCERIHIDADRLKKILDLEVRSAALHDQGGAFTFDEVTVTVTAGSEGPHVHGGDVDLTVRARFTGRPSVVEVVPQLSRSCWVAKLPQCFRFYLTNALAGGTELFAHLFERPLAAILQTKSQHEVAAIA